MEAEVDVADRQDQALREDAAGRPPMLGAPPDAASPAEPAPDRRQGRLKRLILPLAACLLLLGLAGAGWQWWTVWRFVESTDDAYVQSDMAVISPQVSGYVRAVQVADNQQVSAGDVLVAIEDRDFAARVAAGEAEVAARQADIASIQRQIALQRSLVVQAQAAVGGAEADLTQARQDHDRYQALSRQDFASRQRLESATASLQRAEAGVDQARAAVTAAQDRLPVLQAEQQKAEAALRASEASLELARTDLDRTLIRAPVDGVVGNKGVRVGEFVAPGAQLLGIVPLPSVYVVANFKETQLADMRVGQPVEIEVDAWPDQVLHGRVESVAPGTGAQFSLLPPENATGNFTKIVQRVPVRIALPADNPLAGLLRPGLSVVASVDTHGAGAHDRASGVFGALLPAVSIATD
jgi:membrane fusion protein (multidrug efflux system)